MTERTVDIMRYDIVPTRNVQEVFGRRYMSPEDVAALDVALNYKIARSDPRQHFLKVTQGYISQINSDRPRNDAAGRSELSDSIFFNWWNITFPNNEEREKLEGVLRGNHGVEDSISLKELSYAWLISQGLEDAEIAYALNITEDGVANHGTKIRKIINSRTGKSPISKIETAFGCIDIGLVNSMLLQRSVPPESQAKLREISQRRSMGNKMLGQELALDEVAWHGSYTQAAESLGIKLSTLKTRLHALKTKLDGIEKPVHLLVAYKLINQRYA